MQVTEVVSLLGAVGLAPLLAIIVARYVSRSKDKAETGLLKAQAAQVWEGLASSLGEQVQALSQSLSLANNRIFELEKAVANCERNRQLAASECEERIRQLEMRLAASESSKRVMKEDIKHMADKVDHLESKDNGTSFDRS